MQRRVTPQALQHHRFQVRHTMQVLFLHHGRHLLSGGLRCWRRSLNPHNLLVQPALNFRVLDKVGHDPLQRGGSGVSAGIEELAAKAHHLPFRHHEILRLGTLLLFGFERYPSLDKWDQHVLLILPQLKKLLPSVTKYDLSQSRPEVECVKSADIQHKLPLYALDLLDLLVIELVTEAHEHQQAEHGVLEVIHHPYGLIRTEEEAVDEYMEDPAAGMGVGLDPGRMEDLGGEVTAEEAPGGAVGGGADVALVAVEDSGGGGGPGTVGEDGAVLDEGTVGDGVAGNKDGRARANRKSDEGAVLEPETPEDLFILPQGPAQPNQVAYERHRGGSWREGLLGGREEEGFEEEGYAERGKDDEPEKQISRVENVTWSSKLAIGARNSEARLTRENGVKSAVFLSPKFVLRPGSVTNKFYHDINFPRSRIATKSFTAEVVDEAGNPVPLHETYLHHWVVERYYQCEGVDVPKNNDDPGFHQSDIIIVKNSGIGDHGAPQYFGLGSET
ncbi:hypothetical protein RJ639_007869 [Escallonia herrerae]|uniref:Uncharacterized protein n=1 Tax=Escallonia herrerae TaxID=1293975 RepID=A0AA88VX86_9ASTE|nr:hypothetical protein RJ639_007869 [Escallonia herrerae]